MPDIRGGEASSAPRAVPTDVRLLFAARSVRLFAYGLLSVVLALYLASLGFTPGRIGALLGFTLAGDTVISLGLTVIADRAGRRKTLLAGALLMVFAGVLFAFSHDFFVLLIAATLGVISPSGNEIGPFLSIEQAALSESVPFARRTGVFAWYNLAGSLATALGALAGGAVAQRLQDAGRSPVESYRALVETYAGLGVLLALLFTRLSPAAEAAAGKGSPGARTEPPVGPSLGTRIGPPLEPPVGPSLGTRIGPSRGTRIGLHRSRGIVARLASLFALDAFGGGLVIQTLVAYWFHSRFGTRPALLGTIFFGANLLAGVSALVAARIAARIGLINTMVFTHLPSNVLLVLVPLMPNQYLAMAMLLLRFSISQMDVPTRQSYVMAVVRPDERSAAAGVTNVARSVGAALSTVLSGVFLGSAALASVPFFLSGTLKIAYDLLLYRGFRRVAPDTDE